MSFELWRYQLKYVISYCRAVCSDRRRSDRDARVSGLVLGEWDDLGCLAGFAGWLAALSYQLLPRELGWAQWGTPRTPRARFKPFPSLEQVANAAVTLHESPACLAHMLYTVSILAVKVSPCVNAERLDLLQLYTVQTYYCLMVWVHGEHSAVFRGDGRTVYSQLLAALCWDRVYDRLHLLAHAQLNDWREQSIVKLPVVC